MSKGKFWQDIEDFSSLWTIFDMLFLYKLESTELLIIVRISIEFLNNLYFLCVVLWIRLIIEVGVCRSAVPIWASFELIGDVSVIVLLLISFHILFAVGCFASEREVTDGMFIRRFYILIIHSMSGKLICIRSYLLARSSCLKEVFRMWSI